MSDAYLQVEVDPDFRELLTINTHRGLFQYTRLPFGVKSAPANFFNRFMDPMIDDIPGAAAYLDDIIIMGSAPEELHERLRMLLRTINDYGFRL